MMSDVIENNKTPKWLRRLEKESWQAELIISGLALIGTLQLPTFVYWLCDTLINILPTEYYMAGYAITFGYLFGISILTTFFILHFIIRAYWIGLIGLNSAYPNGYKIEDGYFSPIYAKLLVDKLPKIKDSIKSVDLMCSKMFSSAFAFLLMYGMISVSISFLLGFYILTKDYIPLQVWKILGIALIITTIILGVLGHLGRSNKFRNNEKIQKNFFKSSYFFGNIISPFVYKPVTQILFTIHSHSKSVGSNLRIMLPLFFLSTALTLFHIVNSNISHMISVGEGEQLNVHENTVYTTHYLDQYETDQKIFVPVIDSDILEGPFVKLFVPILKNESVIQDNICGKYEKDESLDQNLELKNKNQFSLDCYQKYISIKLNGNQYNAEFLRHRNPQGERKGVVCYIPSTIISEGKNQIKVEKIQNNEGEIYDSYKFHFWYSQSN